MTETDAKPSRIHMRRYIRLGLHVTLAPEIRWRFPITKGLRRGGRAAGKAAGKGDGRLDEPESAEQAAGATDVWIMAIIPIYEAARLAEPVLQNMLEFWEGSIIEIGSVDERTRTVSAPPETRGQRALMTMVRDRALVTEQHLVTIREDGFEMKDGIRLAVQPAPCGSQVKLRVTHEGRELAEYRVRKIKAEAFEMRDVADQLAGTIQKASSRGLPLTDARGRTIRRLTPQDQLVSLRRWGGGESSIQSFASYGAGPAEPDSKPGNPLFRSKWKLERAQEEKGERS